MNEKIQAAFIEMLTNIQSALTAAAEFSSEQIPLVLQEILLYHTWLYAAILAAGILCWIAAVLGIKFAARHWEKIYRIDCEPGVVIGVGVLIIAGVVLIVGSAVQLLKVTLAPRLFLIEYLANLIS